MVKDYITHFFGCRECGENFAKETIDSAKLVLVQNDEVLYLWKVHNSVNKRLAGDEETEDPKYKKIQFPSKEKCPNCYKTNSIMEAVKAANTSLLFNNDEILKYLISFYTVENILGAEKEAMVKEKLDHVNHSQKTKKKVSTEPIVGARDNLNHDEKPVHVDEIVRIPEPINEEKNGDRHRIDYDLIHKGAFPLEDHTVHLDFFLTIAIYLLVILAFACLFLYYKMLRKRAFRAKKKYNL